MPFVPASAAVRLSDAHLALGPSSFVEFVKATEPSLLPSGRATGTVEAPHGTTIVALTFDDGVILAGDRRATMGNVIASRDIEKVFQADEFSAVGIAGTAGLAIEMVKLYQVELEHYEKIEGAVLSFDGKANRLTTMLRGNLQMAMQGLAVVPLFAGWDVDGAKGRIISYDVTGGRYEETGFHSVGSGSMFARGALKKLYTPTLTADEAVHVAVEALYDAADDDSATGGPDLVRGIFPVVTVMTAEGFRRVGDVEMTAVAEAVVAERRAAFRTNQGG